MMHQTQQNFIMFIIVLGQHVSILIESPSGPSKNTDPLNTGDKSLNIRQEYNINIRKISLTKRNITA